MSHVALVIPTLDRIGGAERQVTLLAKGLVKRGWRVSVVALSGTGGSAAGELLAAGAAFLSLEMRKGLADPRGWLRFQRWLKLEAPDVVHAHLAHAAWMVRWLRLGAPARVVVDTLHSSFTGTPGRRLGYRWSGWLSDRVTAVSHAVAEAHIFTRTASKDKLVVLPNGVDVETWRPDATVRETMRRELGLGGEFLWFAAGRLDPVKDYPTLLRAMAGTPEQSLLAVAGTGPMENDLRQLSRELRVERRVRFLGFEPDVRRWMQTADGFALSSRWEGLPIALLEAAACAVPAVATDVPGTREVLVNRQTGLLVVLGSVDALRDAMTRLMRTSREERKSMGESARQHVIQHFSLEEVLNRWEALYRDLLTSNPAASRWSRLK